MYNRHTFIIVNFFFSFYCFIYVRKKIEKVCPWHFDFFSAEEFLNLFFD